MKPTKISLPSLVALIFAGHVHLQSVDIYPGRVTGLVGEVVQINCEVEFGPNFEMTWDFNTAFVYVFSMGKEYYPLGTSKYSVHRTGMNFTLTVRDLNLEDGGEYICTSYTSDAPAFLVVLDTPTITINPPASVDGETTKVTCEARFGGPKKDVILPDHFPNLKMYFNDSSPYEMITAKATTTDVKKYSLISMTKSLTAHSNMDKRNVICELGTVEPFLNTSVDAVLHVLYSVRGVRIAPNEEKYQVGDTISCFAESNPAAGYEWRNVQGGNTINGNQLKITEDMNGENNWECVSKNLINGEWFEERMQLNFVADDPSKSGNDRSPVTIAVVTVIIIILVIIAAAAFIFWKKMKKPKGSRTNGNATNLQELGTVEAEKFLPEKGGSGASEHSIQPNIQQGKDKSNSSNHSIEVEIQEQKIEVTTPLQQNIPQGNDSSLLSENSIKPNIHQGKDGLDSLQHSIEEEEPLVTEPVLPQNIPKGNDGAGLSENSIKPTIQQEKDGTSAPEHSIQPNIQQGKDGSNSFNHSTEITIQDQQSDVTKILQPIIQQEKHGSGTSEHSVKPTIQQEKDGSSALEHSIQQNIPQRNAGSVSSEHSITPTIQQEKDGSGASEHSIEPNIQQGEDGSDSSKHLIEQNIPQGNDCSGSSEHSIKPNIQLGKDGSGSSGHAIEDKKTKAPKLGSYMCNRLLCLVNNKQELDQDGKEILRKLQEDGQSIVEKYPNILSGLIKKADKLIDSEYYEDIIKVIPHGGEDSPLKYLLQLMGDEESIKKLFKHQKKLMSFIQIISSHGDVQYRTECLNYIIINSSRTFGSDIKYSLSGGLWTSEREKREYRFEWSEEYLSTVKDLLDKGADPTWIPPEELKKERKDRTTAQNEFFSRIFVNLWEKNDLHESLLGVLPLMLSKKSNNYEILERTLLHQFVVDYPQFIYYSVNPRWYYIATNLESMPRDFFRQFRNILREILIHDGTLLVQKDFEGRTPLQWFLSGIHLEERIFGEVREIIQMLQSPEVLSSQDKWGWTALHYLAKNFPVIRGEVTQSGRESFLELVKSFANESNVGCQNKDGQTALHCLAEKFPGISEQWREVYQDFVKHLASYDILEIKDNGGRTALHRLADRFTFEIEDWAMETFMEVLKCLAVPRTIRIKDENGYYGNGETALGIISRKWGKKFLRPNKVPEHYKGKFQEILDILSGNN